MTVLNPHPAKSVLAPKVKPSLLGRAFGFKTRLYLTWGALLGLCVFFFLSFDLKFSIILDKWPNLVGLRLGPNGFLQGAALTLFLCICSIGFSLLLGFVTALARLSRSAVAFGVASFYASFFRGTPLLIQILLIYLGLPQLGVVPGAISAGIIALSLNYGAYLSEIFRAGIMAVPPGAARSGCCAWLEPDLGVPPCCAPAGDEDDHPPDHQPVHLDAEGLVAHFGNGGVGSDVPGAVLRTLLIPLYRNARHCRAHLLAAVHWAGAHSAPS